jgi:hypothetical protein
MPNVDSFFAMTRWIRIFHPDGTTSNFNTDTFRDDSLCFSSYVGCNPQFDEIACELIERRDDLIALWQENAWHNWRAQRAAMKEKATRVLLKPLGIPDMSYATERVIFDYDINGNARALLNCSADYVSTLFQVMKVLPNDSTPIGEGCLAKIVAYLYNCTVNVWNYDAQPHTLEIYSPDDFQIPETHPRYADMQEMRLQKVKETSILNPKREINIKIKRLVPSISHCWALLPK